MQKIFLLLCLLLGCSFLGHSQDIIILKTQDTIPCHILQSNAEILKYQVTKGNNVETFTIPANIVASFSINNHGDLPPIYNTKAAKNKTNSFHIGLSLGYGRRFGNLMYDDYYGMNGIEDDLFNGFSWGADAHYFFNKHFGIGINANGLYSASGTYQVNVTGSLNDVSDNQSIFYLGPAFACRFDTKHFLFTTNVSLGLIVWEEELIFHAGDRYDAYTGDLYGYYPEYIEKYNKEVPGFSVGAAAEYKISKYLGVGAKASLTLGGYFPEYGSTDISFSSATIGGYISFRSR